MPQARLPRALSLCPALPGPPIRTRVIPACDTTPRHASHSSWRSHDRQEDPLHARAGQPELPALEQGILDFWKRERVFERSLEQTKGGPVFTFFEGPPTANGQPGVHHVQARSFKDLFPRFRTMQGFHVPRKVAGTHTACRSSWASRRNSA